MNLIVLILRIVYMSKKVTFCSRIRSPSLPGLATLPYRGVDGMSHYRPNDHPRPDLPCHLGSHQVLIPQIRSGGERVAKFDWVLVVHLGRRKFAVTSPSHAGRVPHRQA